LIILNVLNSPSEIINEVWEGGDIGWPERDNVFITSFGLLGIEWDDEEKTIGIEYLPGETEDGWEKMIDYIKDVDKNYIAE
jgi:hypothetical protein